MSTKSQLDHSDEHHLHLDIFEPGKVFLSLRGKSLEFTATAGVVTIAIPAAVWDRIRQIDAVAEGEGIWFTGDDEASTPEEVEP